MQKKSEPQSTAKGSSQTKRKSTVVRKKSTASSNKDTIFLATVIFEAASNICTRLGREVDTGSFPLTYSKMKQLYEEADTWQ